MIPYMVGKLAPNSSHLTRGLVKSVPGKSYFCAVPSQNGEKYVTYPPPQSLNLSTRPLGRRGNYAAKYQVVVQQPPSAPVSPRTNSGSYTGPRLITSSRLEPSETCGDPNPSTRWHHAGPSASCLASTPATRGELSASATSLPATSPCVRPSYGTSQPTSERQFPETR